MHKSNVEILQILLRNECTNEMKSFSICNILEYTQYKYSKVSNDLSKLVLIDYVRKGFKTSRADTYFITPKGIDILRGLCK